MDKVTRKEAFEKGERYYFTGEPCKNGHVSKRLTKNWSCYQCSLGLTKSWREENSEHQAELSKAWRIKNPEKSKKSYSTWKSLNVDSLRKTGKEWRIKNPGRLKLSRKTRYGRLSKATPKWADFKIIEKFYEDARNLSTESLKYQVDHIVPIVHDLVCGLHNQFNLQVLTAPENASKGNRFWPDMP